MQDNARAIQCLLVVCAIVLDLDGSFLFSLLAFLVARSSRECHCQQIRPRLQPDVLRRTPRSVTFAAVMVLLRSQFRRG